MGIQRVGTTADVRAMIRKMVSNDATPQQVVDAFPNINAQAVMNAGKAAASELGKIEPEPTPVAKPGPVVKAAASELGKIEPEPTPVAKPGPVVKAAATVKAVAPK